MPMVTMPRAFGFAGGKVMLAMATAAVMATVPDGASGGERDRPPEPRLVGTVAIAGLEGVAQLAVGGTYACAVTATGGVKCWGANRFGQLGDGSTEHRRSPVDVVGLTDGVVSISVGASHSCALTRSGGVKCWGGNMGSLIGSGDSDGDYFSTPIEFPGLAAGVKAIAAGDRVTCVLTTGGGVKCWGQAFGSARDPATGRFVPVIADFADGVAAMSMRSHHGCLLTTAGGVKCWGGSGDGQIGDNGASRRLVLSDQARWRTLSDVTGLAEGVSAISAGFRHTCALTKAGGVKCWGFNDDGRLGDGSTIRRLVPVDVAGLESGVTMISAGGFHTCALTTMGGVKCWGQNAYGQVGDGSTTSRHTPVEVVGLSAGISAISTGYSNSCALTTAGTVMCWGYDAQGILAGEPQTNR